MKIIRELNEDLEILTEKSESGQKAYYIVGPFLQANTPNRNKRIYPMETLRPKVNEYIENFVKQNRAFGELGHPEGPTINLDRVSHMIKELKEDKNHFIGKAKILDTPFGKIAKSLIDEGAKLGVSSRGLGSLKSNNEGHNIVQDDFMLATAADLVSDPSGLNCFVDGIMEEADWVFESGIWKQRAIEKAQNTIKKASKTELEEAKLAIFKLLLSEYQ